VDRTKGSHDWKGWGRARTLVVQPGGERVSCGWLPWLVAIVMSYILPACKVLSLQRKGI